MWRRQRAGGRCKYKWIFNQTAKYSVPFGKTKHCMDHFAFMSCLFTELGYGRWGILNNETELIGRLGKKARLNACRNMARFLMPGKELGAEFTMFALSSSYSEDVIEGKHEFDNLAAAFPQEQEPDRTVLSLLQRAPQLAPEKILKATQSGGYLLRTKTRAAIELLDQLYQYGEAEGIEIGGPAGEGDEENVDLEKVWGEGREILKKRIEYESCCFRGRWTGAAAFLFGRVG